MACGQSVDNFAVYAQVFHVTHGLAVAAADGSLDTQSSKAVGCALAHLCVMDSAAKHVLSLQSSLALEQHLGDRAGLLGGSPVRHCVPAAEHGGGTISTKFPL